MKIYIVVKLQHEAVHSWPGCNIEEVSFLKYPHRHIFHITCKKKVQHGDRQVEIIMLKRELEKYLNEVGKDFYYRSCEQVAILLLEYFKLSYCQVLEDNENGGEACA